MSIFFSCFFAPLLGMFAISSLKYQDSSFFWWSTGAAIFCFLAGVWFYRLEKLDKEYEFGSWLNRQFRAARERSESELNEIDASNQMSIATLSGIDSEYISSLRRGKERNPSPDTVKAIVKAFAEVRKWDEKKALSIMEEVLQSGKEDTSFRVYLVALALTTLGALWAIGEFVIPMEASWARGLLGAGIVMIPMLVFIGPFLLPKTKNKLSNNERL